MSKSKLIGICVLGSLLSGCVAVPVQEYAGPVVAAPVSAPVIATPVATTVVAPAVVPAPVVIRPWAPWYHRSFGPFWGPHFHHHHR